MSVFNAEYYLRQAIKSILEQTFQDFEYLVINDGSTDASLKIIKSFHDRRIFLIDNLRNLGLAASLNKGIKKAKGKYIARMDADDISLPQRLTKQLDFMKSHEDCGLLGSSYAFINDSDKVIGAMPVIIDPEDIEKALTYQCPFGHGTVMIRSDLLLKNKLFYPTDKPYLEDYRLWIKVIQHTNAYNLPEVLYLRREHDKSLSNIYKPLIKSGSDRLAKKISTEKNDLRPFSIKNAYLKYKKYKKAEKRLYKNVSVAYILEYQNYLFHLALLYLHKKMILSFILSLVVSFCLCPLNYSKSVVHRIHIIYFKR